jgi:phosphopentomutase
MDMMPTPMPMLTPIDIENSDENNGDNMNHQAIKPSNGIVLEGYIKKFVRTLCSAVERDIIKGDPIYTDSVKHKLTQETLTLFTKNPNTHNFHTIISDLLQHIDREYGDDTYAGAYDSSIDTIGCLLFQIWSMYHEREELLNLNIEEINQLVLPYVNLTYKILEQL